VVKTQRKKQRKLFLGWLHKSHEQSRYKQVRMKDGGGVREIIYDDDEEISVDLRKTKASELFFPRCVEIRRCLRWPTRDMLQIKKVAANL